MAGATAQTLAARAVEYFRARGAKDGVAAVLKLRAAAAWAAVQASSKGPLFTSEDKDGLALALKRAQDFLSVCQAEGQQTQQVYVLDAMAHLHLIRDNSNRALKCNKEATVLAKEVPDAAALRRLQESLEIAQVLRGEAAAADARADEVEAETLQVWAQETLQGTLVDQRGRLCLAEYLAHVAKGAGSRQLLKAYLQHQEAQESPESTGMALLLMGKIMLTSSEGLKKLYEAGRSFRAQQLLEPEATALQNLATALLVQPKPDATAALQAAEEALGIFKGTQDLRGQAIASQVMANCKLVLQDRQGCLQSGYEALRLFVAAGDDHGTKLATKLLTSLGQSEQQIRAAAARSQQAARFDGLQTAGAAAGAGAAEAEEATAEVSEELQAIMAEQVVWEYTWVPCETQDPKYFGEKRAGGARRVMVASELHDRRLLRQLANCPRKGAKGEKGEKGEKPFFANLINGRLLPVSSLQSAMEASLCTAVVYDVTRLNHLTQLEVLDATLRLVQALQPLEEPHRVALDVVLASTQNMASVSGVRVPFHSTLWGFCRTARIENPTHEFRVLDVDAKSFKEDMAIITRYLLGAQSTRPFDAIVRKGNLLVSRLVSARAQLKPPLKMVRKQ